MLSVQKRASDPIQLRAIIDLRKQGWTPAEISRHLHICLRTYYYRLEEIGRLATGADGRPRIEAGD